MPSKRAHKGAREGAAPQRNGQEPNGREPNGKEPTEQKPDERGLSLELLVHGVGGTTPEEMLRDPRTERITGDTTAAVYRRTEDADAEERPEEYRDEPVPEAYCWSNLTSGNGARALWLILLPFMVVNLAHWTRPASDGHRRMVRLHGVLVRLVALSLTVLLVGAVCEVALDLIAWQCGGSKECAGQRDWLAFMAAGPDGSGGWWSQPGRRVALAAVLPAAATGLLWWLSHRTWSAYESQQPLDVTVTEDDPKANGRPALSLPGFWYGKRHVARLRAAHTAAGFLTIGAMLAAASTRHDREPGGSAVLNAFGWALEGMLLACGVWVLYVVCSRARKETRTDKDDDSLSVTALPGVALGVTVLAALHGAWSRPGWVSSDAPLPSDATFGVIAVIQGALVVALGVVGVVLYRDRPVERTALGGFAPAAVAMLACALGAVLSGGVAQRVGDWLDGPATPGSSGASIAGPPTLLTWQASIIPLLLVFVLALMAWFAFQLWRRAKALRGKVNAMYPDAPLPDESRSRRIGGAIARAALTDEAPWLVATVAVVTLVLGGCAVLGTVLTDDVPGQAADGAGAVVNGAADTVQALGSWMVGFGFLLFLTWGRRAYRDPSARRTIGILWDVGTFWPRSAHPFAPPCYAERAVPDLAWRMAMWTDKEPTRRLVISGHSQGSVLAASAVWQLDPETRRQIALLTYGSPLERLYARWFPAYFGPAQLEALHGDIRCWSNLWRLTDPIGGPVRLQPVNGHRVDHGPLRDPVDYGRTKERPLPAPILAHSDYQADPAFDEERDELLARLRTPREGLTGVPPQPALVAQAERVGPGRSSG
ncbi:hypothetical protein [Streptomyces sp. NPDC048172]|uniref:hypothetical protein n=1 Tax=Streptomyces sp. NPDC048172 TaxID=3365505 RepID=UPI003724270B